MKARLLRAAVAGVLVLTGLPSGALAQAVQTTLTAPAQVAPSGQANPATLDYRLQARSLAPGIWVVEGANDDFSVANGCNIINTGFIATGDGVLVINTGPSRRYGEQLRALIARTTREPVIGVIHLNLHPDYFLGNQAFADVPRWATAATKAGIAAEASSYETNMYRLCGDWMKGTETVHPDRVLALPADGLWRVGQRHLRLRELKGHTASDLVIQDVASGVSFVGGLVFAERVPTTPHADIPAWLASLQSLALPAGAATVPSHGPVHVDGLGQAQTLRYLRWVDSSFQRHAAAGLEMNDVLRAPVPDEFRRWAAFEAEFTRNVAHLYPRYERAALQPLTPLRVQHAPR